MLESERTMAIWNTRRTLPSHEPDTSIHITQTDFHLCHWVTMEGQGQVTNSTSSTAVPWEPRYMTGPF